VPTQLPRKALIRRYSQRLTGNASIFAHTAQLAKALAPPAIMQSRAVPDLYRFPVILSCLMAKSRIFKDELTAEQIALEKAFKLLCLTNPELSCVLRLWV
jgi:hypothetical protein